MKNWKSWFGTQILERGYDYYESGAVDSIRQTAKGYQAIVEGMEDYKVVIELQGEELSDLWCSCPYAEDGKYCKHMAAVLYELEEEGTDTFSNESAVYDLKQEVQAVLEGISEAEAKKFLAELAAEDAAIGNRIITTYSKSIGQREVERLKQEVDDIVYRYAGREDFIYYRHAYDFINEIEGFLYQKVQALIDNSCNMQAFDVVNYVFVTISNQDMDDSDGGTGMVANICYEFWEQILEQCNQQEKETMFQWFSSHQEGYVVDYMEDYLSDFLMNQFNDKELLLQKLRLLDERIAVDGDKTDCGKLWSARYGYENNILKRLEIMKRLELSENEIAEYREQFRHFSAVRELEIREHLGQKQYNKAIEVLLESKELDKEYPGLVAKYSSMLIDIYQELNLDKDYKDELLFQVFTCRQDNLDYIKRLKQCCPEEWVDYREKLLMEPKAQGIKYQLLEEEQLYKRLLDEIIGSGYIYSLDQYEKVLKKKYPDQVRNAYVNYVIRGAEAAADRVTYKRLMVYLKKISKYPEGEKEALKIAEMWKGEYRRRPAMMDELRKAGF